MGTPEHSDLVIITLNGPGWSRDDGHGQRTYTAGGEAKHAGLLAEHLPARLVLQANRDSKTLENPQIQGSENFPQFLEIIKNLLDTAAVFYIAHAHYLKDEQQLQELMNVIKGKVVLLRATQTEMVNEMLTASELVKTQLREVDGFISQSNELTTQLQQVLPQLEINPDKIHEIWNAVDTNVFHPILVEEKARIRAKYKLSQSVETVYVFSGRLGSSEKNVRKLIRSYLHFANKKTALILVGAYDDSDNGQSLYNTYHNKDNIFFTGALDQSEIAEVLAASTYYVTASEVEGSSNGTLEAMACGLGIVALEGVSGNSALVKPWENGLLFSGNAFQLALAMKTIRLYDEKFDSNFGANSRKRVHEHFSIEEMVKRYHKVIRQLITQKNFQ